VSGTRLNALLLVLLLFGQLLLMAGSVRRADGSRVLRAWFADASAPVVSAAGSVGGAVHGAGGGVSGLWGAQRRSEQLELEVGRLRAELQGAREDVLENERLRRLLDMRRHLAPRSIGASVVTANLSGRTKLIVIDRGGRSGVRPDLPVVAWGGAVGRVLEVGPEHAVVRLLTDEQSGVAAVVQRSRAKGIVLGQGTEEVELAYVPRFSDVVLGDRIVTSGFDGVFPRGFGIGLVFDVRDVPDGSQRIRIVPEVDYDSLEEVLVLLEPVGGELLEAPERPELVPEPQAEEPA
jgi:rod shape-determining protein MreC